MKTLVQGAVKRMRLESTSEKCPEPIISYEAFVEELDTGDSFAASLIDILVKEYAERRTRTNPDERRLISERTAKSLRLQAAPLRIYRERHHHTLNRIASRRSFHSMDYSTAPGEEQPSSEEDEFGTVVGGGFEGARLPSELFDAYNTANEFLQYSAAEATPLATGSPEPADTARETFGVTSPRPSSPPAGLGPYRSSAWVPLSSSSSNVARQNSIRRPVRTRTVDFNEFTHRRRSNFRSLQSSSETRPERPEGATPSGWRYRLREESPVLHEETPAGSSSTQQPRRFFPLNAWQTRRREVGGAFPWSHETTDGSSASRSADQTSTSVPSSSQLWYSLTASAAEASSLPPVPPPMERSSPADLSSDRALSIGPRLRRGGIRPPESLLSRHVSPAAEEEGSLSSGPRESAPAQFSLRIATGEGARPITPLEIGNWQRTGHPTTDLPTPRSLSPIPSHLRDL